MKPVAHDATYNLCSNEHLDARRGTNNRAFAICMTNLGGGAASLSIRLACCAKKRYENVMIVSISRIESFAKQADAKGLSLSSFKEFLTITKAPGPSVQFDVLCFDASIAYRLAIHSKMHGLEINPIVYVIHPRTFSSSISVAPWKRALRDSFLRLYNSNRLSFMDRECLVESCILLDLEASNISGNVIFLPFFENDLYESPSFAKCRNILSVARADFPFKGYLLGLIKEYEQLHNSDSSFKLTIISYGDSYDMLKKATSGLSDVQLINGAFDTELEEWYRWAGIYVGMGTTLLEASARGVPAIKVKSFTYDLSTSGLFSDSPEMLSVYTDETEVPFSKVVLDITSSPDTYLKAANACLDSVNSLYGLAQNADTILDLFDHTAPLKLRSFDLIRTCLRKTKRWVSALFSKH